MALTKDRLIFDASDLATSDQLATFLYASDGTALDHTTGSLHVEIQNASIAVTATDLDIRDLTSASDSVEIKTALGQALAIDASGYITSNINGTVTVAATDLDIRNLSASQDNVGISDGTDSLGVNADGSINVVASATDLDIRSLTNATDYVAIGDESNLVDLQQMDSAFGATSFGFGMFGIRRDAGGSPVSADGDAHPLVFNNDGELKVAADLSSSVADDAADSGNPVKIGGQAAQTLSAVAAGDRYHMQGDLYRRTYVNDSPNIGYAQNFYTVGTVAVQIDSSQAGRKRIVVQNLGSKDIYLNSSNSGTTASGLRVGKGSTIEIPFGENLELWAISSAAGNDIRVMELA